jgi:hypothetical protein
MIAVQTRQTAQTSRSKRHIRFRFLLQRFILLPSRLLFVRLYDAAKPVCMIHNFSALHILHIHLSPTSMQASSSLKHPRNIPSISLLDAIGPNFAHMLMYARSRQNFVRLAGRQQIRS